MYVIDKGKVIAHLTGQLAELLGEGRRPQEGCEFAALPLGDVKVLVEFEHEAGEAATFDDPGEPETLNIIGVLINGEWTDPADWLDDRILAKWMETLREQCADAAVQAREADEVPL